MSLPARFLVPAMVLVLVVVPMILGPLLYFALQPIYPIPFHRAMDRTLLISALAAIALAWPRLAFRQWWPVRPLPWKDTLLGFGAALVSLQLILGAALACRAINLMDAPQVSRIFLGAFTAALAVPFLEETLFRGFLQGELTLLIGRRAGLIIAAIIYTLAHFLKVPTELDHQTVHLWSGVSAMGAAITALLHGPFIGGRGFNLLVAGLILGGTCLRAGHLWFNYGLHSGWILGLLLLTGFTQPSPAAAQSYFGGDLLGSPLTTVVLILLGCWLWRFYRSPFYKPEPGENAP